MTFITISPLLLIAVFLITLLFALAPNGIAKWLLAGLGVVIWLVELKWYFDYISSPAYDYRSPNYGLLFAIVFLTALILTYPLTKLWAGRLILRSRRSNSATMLNLVFAPIFLCGAVFALRPAEYLESNHAPVFDTQYFSSHGVLSLFMLVMGLYFLSAGLQRSEFRQRGLIQNNVFWRWNEFESHQWNELSNTSSELELILKLKPRKLLLKQIKLHVPPSARQMIDELLTQDR